jgi:predicted TIM-barrel fold metal-dependent hydrolase
MFLWKIGNYSIASQNSNLDTVYIESLIPVSLSGYGGNVVREEVKSKAKWFVTDFKELINALWGSNWPYFETEKPRGHSRGRLKWQDEGSS